MRESSSLNSRNGRRVACTCMVDDLVSISDANEGLILSILHDRYLSDLIYTRIRSTLVAINPYRRIDAMYNEVAMNAVANSATGNSPHIFSIAEEAFSSLREDKRRMCRETVIITGESGSGKTENTKLIVQYLTHRVASIDFVLRSTPCFVKERPRSISRSSGSFNSWHQQQQILESNPILEAFGNAKTGKNDNSSRFGKYIDFELEQHYADNRLVMTGAKITHYLLEKSRITRQNAMERNYHIFYFLQVGASPALKSSLRMINTEKFNFAPVDAALDAERLPLDKNGWQLLQEALRILEFNRDTCNSIFKLVGVILHLGQIKFRNRAQRNLDNGSYVEDMKSVQIVTDLMNLKTQRCLVDAFTHKTLTLRRGSSVSNSDSIMRSLHAEHAANTRDSFARELYNKLFDQIIERINGVICRRSGSPTGKKFRIGILDIFGFEQIEGFGMESSTVSACGFEQFCINYANERLHKFFVRCTFEMEQILYEAEEIKWNRLKYVDNQAVLDVLADARLSIIALLNEETIFPKGTDSTLILKIRNNHETFDCQCSEKIIRVLTNNVTKGQDMFMVRHFAGEIVYNVNGFIEKNRDDFSVDLLFLIESYCQDEFIRSLFDSQFPQTTNNRTNGRKTKSLISNFQASLDSLMNLMAKSNPHFVKCIRPNSYKTARCFDKTLVLKQIRFVRPPEPFLKLSFRYSALAETLRIQRLGYPIRFCFLDFLNRYRALVTGTTLNQRTQSVRLAKCLMKCSRKLVRESEQSNSVDMVQIGKSTVFMKAEFHDTIPLTFQDDGNPLVLKRSNLDNWYKSWLTRKVRSTLGILETMDKMKDLQSVVSVCCGLNRCITKRNCLIRIFYIFSSKFGESFKSYLATKRKLHLESRPKICTQNAILTNDDLLRSLIQQIIQSNDENALNTVALHRKLLSVVIKADWHGLVCSMVTDILSVSPQSRQLAILCSVLSLGAPKDPLVLKRLFTTLHSMKSNSWFAVANYRLNRATTSQSLRRLVTPSQWEMEELWGKEMCEIPVWTMSNNRFNLRADSLTTCDEMISNICERLRITDLFGFSLFAAFDYLPDFVADTTLPKMVCMNSTKKSLFFDVIAQNASAASWRLYLRKEIFSPWHDSSLDPVSTHLIFDQIYEGLRIKRDCPVSEYRCRTNEQLASILANIGIVKFPECHRSPAQVLYFIKHFIRHPSDSFLQLFHIQQFELLKTGSSKSLAECQVVNFAYRHWPMYFSRVFWCRRHDALSQKKIAALVNWTGLLLMDERYEHAKDEGDSDVIKFVPFAEMVTISINSEVSDESVACSTEQNGFIVTLVLLQGEQIRLKCHEPTARAIHKILVDFLEGLKKRSVFLIALSDFEWIRRGDLIMAENRNMKTEQEAIAVRSVSGTRKTMLNAGFPIHRIPTVSTNSKPSVKLLQKIRSALFSEKDRLRKPQINEQKPLIQRNVGKYSSLTEYARDNFSEGQTVRFQSTPLRTSLLKTVSPQNVPLAIAMFNEMNRYTETGRILSVDSVIGTCLNHGEDARLRDECYCQILKQLNTDEGKQRYWELLWLITGCCIRPTDSNLLELTKRTLVSRASSGGCGLALDCLNRILRTESKMPRRMPPCFVEVDAIQKGTKDIYHRVFYPDGVQAAIQVDSDLISEELCVRALVQRTRDHDLNHGSSFHLIVFICDENDRGLVKPKSMQKDQESSAVIGQDEYFFDFVRSLLCVLNRKRESTLSLQKQHSHDRGSKSDICYKVLIERRLWINVIPGEDQVLDAAFHFPQELTSFMNGHHAHIDRCVEQNLSEYAFHVLNLYSHLSRASRWPLSSSDLLSLRRRNRKNANASFPSLLLNFPSKEVEEKAAIFRTKFLSLLKESSPITFGAAFFKVRCSDGIDLMAVNARGIVLYNTCTVGETRKLLNRVIPIKLLHSWTAVENDHSNAEPSILITLRENASVLLVYTKDAYRIDELLSAYVNTLGR